TDPSSPWYCWLFHPQPLPGGTLGIMPIPLKPFEGGGDEATERGALGQSDEVSEFAARRKFGSGSGPHTAQVTVFTNEGEEVLSTVLRSGNMTEEERALGFPLSTLATHTESRASRQIRLNPGDIMFIEGTKSPRRPCRGAMNRAAKENGAVIIYRWGSEEWIARP